MLAYLLALSIISVTVSEKIEQAVSSYIEANYNSENVEYQYDFRRVRWSHFPADFDSIDVLRIGKDTPLGNTIFTIGVYKDNDLVKAIPVSVGVTMLVEAVVTDVPINTGEKLHDYTITTRPVTNKNSMPVVDPAALKGKQAKRYIRAGSTIYSSMFENVPVVNIGDKVDIVIEKGLIKVTAEGLVRQKGGVGDIIRVANLGSKKVVRVEVVDSVTVALK